MHMRRIHARDRRRRPVTCRMSGARPRAFPDPPDDNLTAGTGEISRFLFGELLRMPRVFQRVGLTEGLRVAPSPMWPSAPLNSIGASAA